MTERQENLPPHDEAEEVAPGILRIQLPIFLPGLGHVNCYVLEDGRGLTLVDPGLPDPASADALTSRLRAAGLPPERIHTVVVTHSHPDHFGGAGRLKVERSCEVLAHRHFHTPFDGPPPAGPADVVADLEPLHLAQDGPAGGTDAGDAASEPANRRLREVLFGDGPIPDIPARWTPWGEDGFRPQPGELEFMRSWDRLSKEGLLSLDPTRRLDDEQLVRLGGRDWQVVHTPGHTGDHICLLDPAAGVLLSGDHVLPTITPHISGLTRSPDSLADFVGALRRVAALPDVTTVLPAHGLVFTDLAGRVEAIVAHHEERLDRLEVLGEELGTDTVRAYSHRLFQERSWGPMAESETYAHLEHLRLLGHMTARTGEDGRLRYTPLEHGERPRLGAGTAA